MGFLDSIEGMAGAAMSGGDNAKVAGGLVEALREHPGGLGAVLTNLRENGLGAHADAMQNGETPTVSPDQVVTGLQGTGLLESVAAKAGVSPEVAKVALATVLPMVVAHMSQNGEGGVGGLLSKFL